MPKVAHANGEHLSLEPTKISLLEMVLVFASSIYEVIIFFEKHLTRLQKFFSAIYLKMKFENNNPNDAPFCVKHNLGLRRTISCEFIINDNKKMPPPLLDNILSDISLDACDVLLTGSIKPGYRVYELNVSPLGYGLPGTFVQRFKKPQKPIWKLP
jgi:hypothetical protein